MREKERERDRQKGRQRPEAGEKAIDLSCSGVTVRFNGIRWESTISVEFDILFDFQIIE